MLSDAELVTLALITTRPGQALIGGRSYYGTASDATGEA
jgi:hypothetical protein